MRRNLENRFLLPSLLIASLFFSGQAHGAQTPAQQAYSNALNLCLGQYQQQNIPQSQLHSFLNACLKANGITAPVTFPLPPPPAPPTPGQ